MEDHKAQEEGKKCNDYTKNSIGTIISNPCYQYLDANKTLTVCTCHYHSHIFYCANHGCTKGI